MNIALIFAGGTGVRMNSKTRPKQFLTLHGKSILIHTLEHFEFHPQIDAIIVACLEGWIEQLKVEINKFGLKKVKWIVPGGKTGQESIYNALNKLKKEIRISEEDIILIHDGVRPLIDSQLISNNIESVKNFGNAVTVANESETIAIVGSDEHINNIINRNQIRIAKAPQSFYAKDVIEAHENSIKDGINNFIDSATLMSYYGHRLHTVICSQENIKITTAIDFYMFKAMLDARENAQVFG